MSYIEELKDLISTTRVRLSLSSVETYFFLMSAFATLGMIFKIFADIGQGGNTTLDLYEIFGMFGLIFLAIAIGGLIYFTAMLSIYFDDLYKLLNDPIYSSNFVFTRLVTPAARALILLISLSLFVYAIAVF